MASPLLPGIFPTTSHQLALFMTHRAATQPQLLQLLQWLTLHKRRSEPTRQSLSGTRLHTVDGCEILHQFIGGLSMFTPLLIGLQTSKVLQDFFLVPRKNLDGHHWFLGEIPLDEISLWLEGQAR